MSNYIVTTDFAAKDALITGDPNKKAQGTQVSVELNNIASAIATKEDTANKGSVSGYAGLDSNGDVPDAQISSNFPRLDQANTYTGTTVVPSSYPIRLSGADPFLAFNETDGSANNKLWDMGSGGEAFIMRALTDAGVATNWLRVDRTSNTIDNINLLATTVQINSNTAWHAGNDGAGSGLDADLLDGFNSTAFAATSHNHSAADLTSGTLADARVVASNVTQHQASLTILAPQITTSIGTTAGSFALTSGNVEQVITVTGAATVTIDNTSASGFTAGDSVALMRQTSGAVTFAAGGAQTIQSPGSRLTIPEQNGIAVATYLGSNVWVLSGV